KQLKTLEKNFELGNKLAQRLVPRPNSSRDYDELKRQVKSLKHETALFKLKIKSLRLR
ncbi:unnamed protein product, partial [Brassica rapa subsp. trilocularis]